MIGTHVSHASSSISQIQMHVVCIMHTTDRPESEKALLNALQYQNNLYFQKREEANNTFSDY
jgi:hypothetical protein